MMSESSADQLPGLGPDHCIVDVLLGLAVDDHIVQESILIPVFVVHFDVHALAGALKITEHPFGYGGGGLYLGYVPAQVEHFLFGLGDNIVGKEKGDHPQKEHKDDQTSHAPLQGNPGGFHGGKLIVLGKGPKGQDGREQDRQRKDLVHQGGYKVKDELANDDHAKALSRQIIDEQPYSLKNENDYQNDEGTDKIVQKPF